MPIEIDNFELLKSLVDPQSEDDYWLVELIGRKKDWPDLLKSQQHFGSYFITSQRMLSALEAEIKARCKLNHARAYLYPSPKSKKKTALALMKKLLSEVECDDFTGLFGSMTSASAECSAQRGRKLFVLDCDDLKAPLEEAAREVISLVKTCKTSLSQPREPIVAPTPNGFHILASPFDTLEFSREANLLKTCTCEVKHSSPTVLCFFG